MKYLCGFIGLKAVTAQLVSTHMELSVVLFILALQTAGIFIMVKAPRAVRWYMIAFSALGMLRLPA